MQNFLLHQEDNTIDVGLILFPDLRFRKDEQIHLCGAENLKFELLILLLLVRQE